MRTLSLVLVSALLVACGVSDAPGARQASAPSAPATPAAAPSPPPTAEQPEEQAPVRPKDPGGLKLAPAELQPQLSPSTLSAPGALIQPPYDPATQQIADTAAADLATRLGVAQPDVELVAIYSVIWPDASMGCPRKGMAYKQVPVDGVQIQLRSAGALYAYHGGGGRTPFLCEGAATEIAPAQPIGGDLSR